MTDPTIPLNNRTSPESTTDWFLWCLFVFILAITALYLFRPFFDPDFYWHLKTGEWIWQHSALPYQDPFGVAPNPTPPPETIFILTSYWLHQSILYLCYACGGGAGLVLFRWFVIICYFLIFASWTNLRNRNVLMVIAVVTVMILEFYFAERPQFASFVCFGILLTLLLKFVDQPEARPLCSVVISAALVMVI